MKFTREQIDGWPMWVRFIFYFFHSCGPYTVSGNGWYHICDKCGYEYITRKYIEDNP